MSSTARLLLVRHGQSTWNVEGRWQGQADPPLSPLGEAQAREAAEHLRDVAFDGVAASDLQRARRTAELLAGALGLGAIALDEGLRERDVGEWSGLTRADIDARWPGRLQAWRERRVDRPPGGEVDDAFAARILAAVARVAAPGGTRLVVTHGGVIAVLGQQAGLDYRAPGNLGGRWFEWNPATSRLTAGDAVTLPEPDHRSAPVSQ